MIRLSDSGQSAMAIWTASSAATLTLLKVGWTESPKGRENINVSLLTSCGEALGAKSAHYFHFHNQRLL